MYALTMASRRVSAEALGHLTTSRGRIHPDKERRDVCATRGCSHFAEMLGRTKTEWLIAMFEVYFDDSGTDSQSDIAIAACYVSTKRAWGRFVNAWDRVRHEEGFDVFHMAEFRAPREQRHEPFCDWDDDKKDRVYWRLANIINENKRIGIAVALPKEVYDQKVPERIRRSHGEDHYAFAVIKCLFLLAKWRDASLITLPTEIVFDWEEPGSKKRSEISRILDSLDDSIAKRFGMEYQGYSFHRRSDFKPLQAADILAWQMNRHMRKIYPGPDREEAAHEGFRILREDQEMDLGFLTPKNIDDWLNKIENFEKGYGELS